MVPPRPSAHAHPAPHILISRPFVPPKVGAIANATLARSLLDIYLGANPVSPGAKADMGRGLAAMVLA